MFMMAKQFLRKALKLLLVFLLSESIFTTFVRKPFKEVHDCDQVFNTNCVKQCTDLKRQLCYCKEYKVLEQTNHKCLCAPDKSECEKELKDFLNSL